MTAAEACRLNGWTVGTLLTGDEGYGPSIIQITAIGRREILARYISRPTSPVCDDNYESSWDLSCRPWRVLS